MKTEFTDNEIAEIFGSRKNGPLFTEQEIDFIFGPDDDEPLISDASMRIMQELGLVDDIKQDNKSERKSLLPKRIDDACQDAVNESSFFRNVKAPKFNFQLSSLGHKKLPDIKPSPPSAIRPKI